MKIHDISMPIHKNMSVYKNREEKRPILTVTRDFNNGSAYESKIEMDLHTGTHIDAPLHMIQDGKTIETLSLEKVITECKVYELTNINDNAIKREYLKGLDINTNDFVLFKTKNSYDESFNPDFVFLEKTAAQYLKELNVKGVGIDALGIERSQPEHETHKILFEAGIVIIEGLRLKDIQAGTYQLIALPLPIIGAEAAPARVILVEQ